MIGSSVPLIIVLALATAVGLLCVVAFGGMPGVTRRVVRSFWCAERRGTVTAGFDEEVWDGKRVNVAHCTAFAPPTAVSCSKACLALRKLPAPAAHADAA